MLGLVLALFGGVMGYGLLGWSAGGFAAGAAIGVFAGWASDLRDRLVKIEKRLARLEQLDRRWEPAQAQTTAAGPDPRVPDPRVPDARVPNARAASGLPPERDLAEAARGMAEAAAARRAAQAAAARTTAESAAAGAASGSAAQPERAAAEHDGAPAGTDRAPADTDRAAAAAAERGRRRARQFPRQPQLGSQDLFLLR
jgi:hypothetical protein